MTTSRTLALLLACGLLTGTSACSSNPVVVEHPPRAEGQADRSQANAVPRSRTNAKRAGEADGNALLLDGDVNEWPQDLVLWGDADHVYFRFSVEGANYTLQHSETPTVLLFDVDGNPATGRRENRSGIADMGFDLEVVFSPESTKNQGARASLLDANGGRQELNVYEIGLVTAPTFSNQWYEGRIARTGDALNALPEAGLRTRGNVGLVAATLDKTGRIDAYSDPSVFTLPQADQGDATLADATLPAKPAGAVRVMSYNIHRSAPTTKPESFARLIQATSPDVLLFQEWEAGDADSVRGWLTAMASGQGEWEVVKPEGDLRTGGGVVIASRHATAKMIERVTTGSETPKPVRFAAAHVAAPSADLFVGSVHLKCCGFAGSPEDQARAMEAAAINDTFQATANQRLATGTRPLIRVIAGDFNLVGSRTPLDRMRAGLDADGGDLAIAMPITLGDRTMTTWSESSEPFPPGRLDYVLYSPSSASVANAFVLDTRRLSEAALARLGLDRNDSGGSDHMPVVVDLIAK